MLTFRERAAEGLKMGDSFKTSRTLTNEDLLRFARVSRDYNPVHFDERFAKARNFAAPICHGLLAASLVTELGGQIAWLASSMNFRFKGPVYVGETVTCTLEITEIDQNGRATASATIVKEDGSTAIEAEIGGIVPGDKERKVLREMLSEGDPTNGLADILQGHGEVSVLPLCLASCIMVSFAVARGAFRSACGFASSRRASLGQVATQSPRPMHR